MINFFKVGCTSTSTKPLNQIERTLKTNMHTKMRYQLLIFQFPTFSLLYYLIH